jgi:hypothetical protein
MMRRLFLAMTATALLVTGLVAGPAVASTATPYHGDYMGRADGHRSVILSYRHNLVQNITVNGNVLLKQGHVSHGTFSTSENGIHFQGQWFGDYTVSGHYSYHSHGHKVVVHFTVHAFAY